ncbi:MAG: O-antigen ligase family protein, partial [Gammaproteobacteria bacterium]|nr:O-antigen ligase family protein [Gammaproteobacteria bacterium]
ALAAAVMAWYLHSLMDAPQLLALTFVVAVVVGLAILFIPPVQHRIAASIHLGRSDATLARLSGRWTIWRLLVPTIRRNLLLGVGYRSYWNQQSRDQMRRDCGFENPVWTAHSIYIEALLSGGIIALALLLLTAVHVLWLAFSVHNSEGSFVVALIMFVLVSGGAESGFTLPRFATFAVILVLTAFGGGGYIP